MGAFSNSYDYDYGLAGGDERKRSVCVCRNRQQNPQEYNAEVQWGEGKIKEKLQCRVKVMWWLRWWLQKLARDIRSIFLFWSETNSIVMNKNEQSAMYASLSSWMKNEYINDTFSWQRPRGGMSQEIVRTSRLTLKAIQQKLSHKVGNSTIHGANMYFLSSQKLQEDKQVDYIWNGPSWALWVLALGKNL